MGNYLFLSEQGVKEREMPLPLLSSFRKDALIRKVAPGMNIKNRSNLLISCIQCIFIPLTRIYSMCPATRRSRNRETWPISLMSPTEQWVSAPRPGPSAGNLGHGCQESADRVSSPQSPSAHGGPSTSLSFLSISSHLPLLIWVTHQPGAIFVMKG